MIAKEPQYQTRVSRSRYYPALFPSTTPAWSPRPSTGAVASPVCPVMRAEFSHDRREIEEYSHPFAHHVSNLMCPEGHVGEARRVWEPATTPAGTVKGNTGHAAACIMPEHALRPLREMYRSFAVRIIVSTVAQTNGTAIA
jgi:hypothetical protein